MKSEFGNRPLPRSIYTFALAVACSSCSGESGSGDAQNTGGNTDTGATTPRTTGGTTSTGGVKATGGALATGGVSSSNSAISSGGLVNTTGVTSAGGTSSATVTSSPGGKPSTGGATSSGGKSSTGGTTNTSGKTGTGGKTSTGGTTGTGGKASTGGAASVGGATSKGGASSVGGSTGTVVNGCIVKLEGWAASADTTGGGNVAPQKVTSVAELRTLSKDETPRVLQLEGTYDLGDAYLSVGSNKTFIGVGKSTIIKAKTAGFSLRHSQNVILRNLNVHGGGDVGTEGGDAITATVADRLWFDHLTVIDGPDGILDLTQGTTNVTISWCKIYYTSSSQPHRYAMQFSSGSGSGDTDKGKLDITMHHNWFGDLVNQRMPRHLWGRGHIYNNFYNSPGNEYCIGAGSLASLLIENNYFKDVVDPFRLQDNGPVHIVATGNVFDKATGKQETGALGSGTAGPPPGPWTPTYGYSLDEANNVPDLVKRCAGPQ